MVMNRSRLGAVLGLALVAIGWGAIPLVVREDVPASQLVTARVWLGAAALLAIMAARGVVRFPSVHRGRVLASGLILAAHWGLFFIAIKETTVAVALAVLYLGPVIAAVAAGPILGEQVGLRSRIGLVMALAGVLALVRPGAGATLAGVAAALAAALLMAALMLVAKPAAEELGGFVVAGWELSIAAIVMIPWLPATVAGAPDHWWQLLVLGVVLTGLLFAAYWSAMRHLPVTVTGVMMYLEPVAATLLAAIVLAEQPDVLGWIGVASVVVGGVLAASEVAEVEVMSAHAAV